MRRWRAIDAEKKREARCRDKLKRNYGITIEQYDALLVKQNGLCAICQNVSGRKKLSVDHDHQTGKVRGLLCNPCNLSLGGFKDRSKLLAQAIIYLDKYRPLADDTSSE